ncbi:MAG: c-type cytochrome [Pirellulales bacterium]|nr:c-type cytochrome [Pirellulales bacterium]
MAFYLVGLLTLLQPAQAAAVDPVESPQVPGFDRFVRQRVLSSEAGGKLLLSELSCTACHRSTRSELAPKRGPDLAGVSQRLHTEWLQRFLQNPQKVKPGTTMPGMLHSLAAGDRPQAARALAAFLATLPAQQPLKLLSTGSAPVASAFWSKGNEQRGRQLFHRVGSVACHQGDADYRSEKVYRSDREKSLAELKLDPEERQELAADDAPQPFRSVPLVHLEAKYGLQSLTYFLIDPLQVRPAGRMPNLQLTPDEAADIATFLLPDDAREVVRRAPEDPDLVGRG